MRFEPGHTLMEKLQEFLANNFDVDSEDSYAANGPWALSDVIWDLCEVTAVDMTPNNCYNVTAYQSQSFYPVAWQDSDMLFEEESKDQVMEAVKDSFAIHLWNKMSRETQLDLEKDTALKTIARENCPNTWKQLK